MLYRRISFGFKNFYNEIGLSPHFTFRGFLKRTQRKYPLMTKAFRFTSFYTLLFFTTQAFIPGVSLPFQRQFKLMLVIKFTKIIKKWHTAIGQQNIQQYLVSLHQILWYVFQQGIEEKGSIIFYLKEMNDWAQKASDGNNRQQKKIVRAIHLRNFSDILNQMIRKVQLKSNQNYFMGDEQIMKQFQKAVRIAVIENKDNIQSYDKKDYCLCFHIFEYLLKFERNEKKVLVIEMLIEAISETNRNFLMDSLVKQQGIKNELKRIYKELEGSRPIILTLLEEVDRAQKVKQEK